MAKHELQNHCGYILNVIRPRILRRSRAQMIGYNQMSLQIIDQMEYGGDQGPADCETYWQQQLRCYVENGGRAHKDQNLIQLSLSLSALYGNKFIYYKDTMLVITQGKVVPRLRLVLLLFCSL